MPHKPLPVQIFRRDRLDAASSSQECLQRSRRLLAETGDMIDPLRSGKPLQKEPPVTTADSDES